MSFVSKICHPTTFFFRDGAKLEYGNIEIVAPNSTSFSVDDLYNFRSFFNDKMPQTHNLDFIRNTMQIHEDIFKHQVRELHRLYSVQKLLMEELKKELNQKKRYHRSPMITSGNQTNYLYTFGIQSFRDDHPSPTERSGSCSGETTTATRLMPTRMFDLERPADEDISTGVSAVDSNQTPAVNDEESEVELTLSIGGICGRGGSSKSKKSEANCQQEVLDLPTGRAEADCSCSAPTTPVSSSSATFDQEKKHPHWLFRSLSINKTT